MIMPKDKHHRGELDIPPIAASDPKGLELARIWAAGGRQHVILRPDLWSDPTAWGLMLVDLARHVANAYEETGKGNREKVLAQNRHGFEIEWDHPTDETTGAMMK
jgi:hypothetical protein